MRLAKHCNGTSPEPLLDALAEEADTFTEVFALSACRFKGTVLPHAAKRIHDKRWYVVRNALYLLRECGGANYVHIIRPLVKHADSRLI